MMDRGTVLWASVVGVLGVGVLDALGVIPSREMTHTLGALRAGVFYGSGIALAAVAIEAIRRLRGVRR